MSRWTKHIGIGEPLIIGGEEFLLKPLSTEHMGLFFKAMKAFSGATGEGSSNEDIFKNMTDEGINAIKGLIEKTLEASYPTEINEEMKIFGLKYMQELLPKIMEINTSSTKGANKVDKINKVRNRLNANSKPVT